MRVPVTPQRLLAASLVVAAAGCAPRRADWTRLWPARWTWHSSGDHWVRGVTGGDRVFHVGRRGRFFRATLLGAGPRPGSVTLTGPDTGASWTIAPGEERAVGLRLGGAGEYTLRTSGGAVAGEPRVGRPGKRRLVVLILVDTLRADHVRPDLMPGVTRFFAQGRVWTQATAHASWTIPSVASLFTGRPVLDLTTPEGDLLGVPEGDDTWAEALDRAGYAGGAFVANYTVAVLNGFGRGFSSYRVSAARKREEPDAAWVVAGARRWLAAHRGENSFLYLHFMDPHEPYRDHEDGRVGPPIPPLAHRERTPSPAEARLLRELYAGEVRHVDRILTPFLHELPPETVVAFTADHGESLGEHGCWGHGLALYQEQIAVPLMLRGPGVPAGKVGSPVGLKDLAPTLLASAGVPADPSMAGRSLLAGGSPGPIISATYGAGPLRWTWRRGSDKVILRLAPQPGLSTVARSAMIEKSPLPAGAFRFRLDADPGEDHPMPLDEDVLLPVGRAFAATAGRMVPGLEVMAWGLRRPVELRVHLGGVLQPVQAFSTGPMALTQHGGAVTVSCRDPFPVCAVGGSVSPRPRRLRLLPAGAPWVEPPGGCDVPVGELTMPRAFPAPGLFAWWNPPRRRLVRGYRETLQKLRALGYLE